jgi:hypothetical protein
MSGFDYKGKKLYPVKAAFIADCGTQMHTYAESIDEHETTFEYKIMWQIKDGHGIDAIEDLSDCCDWDSFEVIEYGEKLGE